MLTTEVFSSLHGFGSDELGQGFEVFNGEILVDVDFGGQQITNAFLDVHDAQGRNWQFSGLAGGPLGLSNDARLELNGSCSGCASGTAASAFIFTTFLGQNAEGALGSFGAQTGTFAVDAPEAIAGTWVGDRFNFGQ